jgi:hypothetical protein
MLALLDRADNDDCVIPPWRAPSLRAVDRDTSLAHSTVARVLAHLELHGWLNREGRKPGQMASTRGAGRGRSGTRWTLIPGAVPGQCGCARPDGPVRKPPDSQMVRSSDRLDGPIGSDVPAGHDPDRTKGVSEGENRERASVLALWKEEERWR